MWPISVVLRVIHGVFAAVLIIISAQARAASETVTVEPSGEAYNFVTHYRVRISASPSEVWPVLIDFGAWMYEFEQSTVSGQPGTPGQVLRLYEGQDYLTQVTAVVPLKMISIVNLPLTIRGESGTGIGVFTLHEIGDKTEVSLNMSRRYAPAGEGFEVLKATRQTAEFQARTRAMWQNRFLVRLKSLVEGETDADS